MIVGNKYNVVDKWWCVVIDGVLLFVILYLVFNEV